MVAVSPVVQAKILSMALDGRIETLEVSQLMAGMITFTMFLGFMKFGSVALGNA